MVTLAWRKKSKQDKKPIIWGVLLGRIGKLVRVASATTHVVGFLYLKIFMKNEEIKLSESNKITLAWGVIIVAGIFFYFVFSSTSANQPVAQPDSVATSSTFYTQSDNTHVRSCGSLSCSITGTYPANTSFILPYATTDNMPEWIKLDFNDGTSGYVNKITLGQSMVSTDSGYSTTDQSQPNTNTAATTNAGVNLSSLVKEWSPRVVRIVCSDSNYVASGSGVLTRMSFPSLNESNVATLITNNHVITDETTGYSYPNCNFQITGSNQILTLYTANAQVSTSQDVAYFPAPNVTNPPPGAQTAMSICSASDVEVGDKIAILGYPADGGTGQASTAITVTEGIISSYDGEYYVTDAKIDHGNSGGGAILEKDDCYLGIPTWVESGGFESFGRILSASSFLN